ncbi:hypothetical protein FQZ97_1024340 [compost metagenome]
MGDVLAVAEHHLVHAACTQKLPAVRRPGGRFGAGRAGGSVGGGGRQRTGFLRNSERGGDDAARARGVARRQPRSRGAHALRTDGAQRCRPAPTSHSPPSEGASEACGAGCLGDLSSFAMEAEATRIDLDLPPRLELLARTPAVCPGPLGKAGNCEGEKRKSDLRRGRLFWWAKGVVAPRISGLVWRR